ncbi:MAG: GHKL domain-containing protein, partial [Methanobacteriota archaeon]
NLLKLLKNDSFVIVPLFTKKELLGVIIADNCINKREITPEDVEGLKLFANQASSAIENARLYRTLESKIQDLKQAYQELEENQQKLIQAKRLAAIGEMSARVAHEIRNPLVSIGGFARLIERKISGDDQLKQYAGIIKEQVSNLENILNNILATANPPRPQDGRVSIPHLVEQITAVLHNAISRRNIKLFIKLPNTEVFVRGDEKLLHQAFLNLLKNAIEALDKKTGQREITIQVVDNQKTVDIYLRDNGEGIPEAVLPKIFQTFFTTKSSGTGLGLSIVHQIVEAHNGTIQVESEAGKGTTFIVQLPRVFQLEALPEK